MLSTPASRPTVVEDRRFFIAQYRKTAPLNVFSILVKLANSLGWAWLNNPSLLGYYSLASVPTSITSRALFAGAMARVRLPNTTSTEEDQRIVASAAIFDAAALGLFAVGLAVFFLATRAEIVRNLGPGLFVAISVLSIFEVLPSLAIETCGAKRRYAWNFTHSNGRLVAILVTLGLFIACKVSLPQAGIEVWVASSLAAVALALFYLIRKKLLAWPLRFDTGFIETVRKRWGGLVLYRGGFILFGGVPSLVIAYMPGAHEVGLFSFAFTLSNFLYAGLAPINEQVYGPSLSQLIHKREGRLLKRRIAQMLSITAVISVAGSAALLWGGEPALRLIGKYQFLESFKLLGPLLAYQSLLMLSATFTYPLFCMNHFKSLGVSYAAGALAAYAWFAVFHADVSRAIVGLPIAGGILLISSALQLTSRWGELS